MSLIILSIPIYFLLIGIELLVQYFSGQKLYRLNDAITNISCGIVSQLSGILFKVLSFGVYILIYENLRLATIEPTWLSWLLLFIGVDFFYYWAHRMSHEVNLFWGGHVVHHQSEDYNFSVALRQSSFQVIWTFAFYLPLALVGFDPLDFLLVNALTTLYQFWIHTETIGKLGILEYVFNTPSHHRVHHGRDPKYIDKNHAGVLIIWDRLFGTFQNEEERPVYGITQPVNSWNPLWVNFSHYQRMWVEFLKIDGFMNKVRFLYKKPGWLPSELGGYRSPKEVDRKVYRKFDTSSPLRIRLYVLIQFGVLLAITSLFLFNYSTLPPYFTWVGAVFILLSVLSLGSLLENRSWAGKIEISRYFALVILIVAGYLFSIVSIPVMLIGIILSFISIFSIILITYVKAHTAA